MAIYITGDTHGSVDAHKLNAKHFGTIAKELTKNDFVIICGDFGFVWEWVQYQKDDWWLNWLEKKPWTTLFVDGNHENHERLNLMDIDIWHGGKVHTIRPSVIHLMRGEIYDIDGKSFFTMGGADSVDKAFRKEGVSWWPEEIPNAIERGNAFDNLRKANWKVDYVITHTPPTKIIKQILYAHHDEDEYTDWLQGIADKLQFSKWFFGHMHEDFQMNPDSRFEALYHDFYELETATRTRPSLTRPQQRKQKKTLGEQIDEFLGVKPIDPKETLIGWPDDKIEAVLNTETEEELNSVLAVLDSDDEK